MKTLAALGMAAAFACAGVAIGSAGTFPSAAGGSALRPAMQDASLLHSAKCVMKDDKLVCDIPQIPEKHGGKKKQEGSGLETCTIQTKKGGGGCTAPLKFVCETMKSGKKCCGCVEDKNAKKKDEKKAAKVKVWNCTAQVRAIAGGGSQVMARQLPGNSAAEAQGQFRATTPGFVVESPIDCKQIN
jgi:hypothetical protein